MYHIARAFWLQKQRNQSSIRERFSNSSISLTSILPEASQGWFLLMCGLCMPPRSSHLRYLPSPLPVPSWTGCGSYCRWYSIPFALTFSPTLSTSDGFPILRSQICEMCTSPLSPLPRSINAPYGIRLSTVPLKHGSRHDHRDLVIALLRLCLECDRLSGKHELFAPHPP